MALGHPLYSTSCKVSFVSAATCSLAELFSVCRSNKEIPGKLMKISEYQFRSGNSYCSRPFEFLSAQRARAMETIDGSFGKHTLWGENCLKDGGIVVFSQMERSLSFVLPSILELLF